MTRQTQSIEIYVGRRIRAVTFSANGEYIVGGDEGVQVWRMEDCKHSARLETHNARILCLTASRNGRWIAAGTDCGRVFMWDANTHERVCMLRDGYLQVFGLDFSPDSTRLVSASANWTATVRDTTTRKQVQTLSHDYWVIAVKYCSRGDRIATATPDSVQVWDNDGHSLVEIEVKVTPYYNSGLRWLNDHIFIVSEKKIKEFDASTGSTVSEWSVPNSNSSSCIAISQHGEFFAYKDTVTFRDASTRAQLTLSQHPQDILSIALSSDERFLAVSGSGQKISILNLSRIAERTTCASELRLDSSVSETSVQSKPSTQLDTQPCFPTPESENGIALKAIPHVDPSDSSTSGLSDPPNSSVEPDTRPRLSTRENNNNAVLNAIPHLDANSSSMSGPSNLPNSTAKPDTRPHFSTPENDSNVVSKATCLDSDATSTSRLREWAKVTLKFYSWKVALGAAVDYGFPRVAAYQVMCEQLETINRTTGAVECFFQMTKELGGEMNLPDEQTEWAVHFRQRSIKKLEYLGDAAVRGNQYDVAISKYTNALSLKPSSPEGILIKRGKAFAATGLWKEAADDANQVNTLDLSSPWALDRLRTIKECERLGDTAVETHRYDDAISNYTRALSLCHPSPQEIFIKRSEAFLAAGLRKEALEDTNQVIAFDPSSPGALDLKQRALEKLGHMAADARRYEEAIAHYTILLSLNLNPPSQQDVLVRRSKAFLKTGSLKQALDDADQVITLDPLSPWGYEMKHAILHKSGDYRGAVDTLEMMLSRMAESPDPDIQVHHDQYISPSSIRTTIHKIVQRTIGHLPRVLINTTSGRLHGRAQLALAFESQPIFNELVSSMMRRIDYVRIEREVRQYFRYVMLSHKWEDNEPLFQQVVHMTVYDLNKSPTHDKLQMFCKIVNDAGFHWAWSDTCCIDKSDHFVLQEALVAMFKWYQSSTMMIVFLRGVRSSSQCGALTRSIWNTRAWTLQEYFASKVIHFYTEDWTPYLNLKSPNHKLSPEVISEMEQATGMSAQQLMGLRPGLSNIREKLCLASTRQTTLVEDVAYSLLGIFSVTGIPAIYGEGESSLGRLLAHVLTGSGDAGILAWTGESSNFNSCLPTHITVFSEPATSHFPQLLQDTEMQNIAITSHLSSFELNTALKLYDCLNDLPPPWFAATRMKLPCIAFQLSPLSSYRTRSGWIHRVDTHAFGRVQIKTRLDLSRMNYLYLIHPWLDTLLERDDNSNVVVEEDMPPSPQSTHNEELSDEVYNSSTSLPELLSLSQPAVAHARMVMIDRETRARRLVARLRQPFGALLLTLAPTRGRAMDYKRVAADNLITVRLQEDFPLADILDNVRTLDVL